MQMNEQLNELLPLVSKPGRYLGDEVNAVKKDLDKVALKVALAFPDLYEIGISNLGLQILYSILNDRDDIASERVYAPWDDMERLLREREIPLCSLESSLPLHNFDIIGFSLQHELAYTNLLNMLDLGKIPLLSSSRQNNDTLVIAGGPAAFNPEPMADFIDAFLLGDGEEALVEICDLFLQWKKEKGDRKELLTALSSIEGVYVPALYSFDFTNTGKIEAIKGPGDNEKKTKRRVLTDLNDAPYPENFIVPNIKPVHDRIPLEVTRGCSRFCRFCQAAFIYLPTRERSPEKILSIGQKALKNTGIDEVALLSLSTGDYSCLEALLPELIDEYGHSHTKLSFPSLRVDTMTPGIMAEMKKAKSNSFTIAPEAGSQRLRDLVNKCITEEQILNTTAEIAKAGCQSIKLYYMIGLPTETKEDLDEIIHLSRAILKVGKKEGKISKITINISNFVPKSHTPFQWARQDSLEEFKEKLNYLKRTVKDRQISLKWQAPEMSILEGVFSRGDRRLGKAILAAFEQGARFDGWGEKMNYTLWEEAFNKCALSVESYLQKRKEDAILPWDLIDIGIDKSFLLKELEKSALGEETEDCRYTNCFACGVCDHKQIKIESFKNTQIPHHESKDELYIPLRKKIRVKYAKKDRARFLGHIDTMEKIIRMLRRTAFPLRYSQGFKPAPKVSFSSPIPLGTESLSEYFEFEIEKDISPENILDAMKILSPPNIDILEVTAIQQKEPSLSDAVAEEIYCITVPEEVISGTALAELTESFLKSTQWPTIKKTKKGERTVDLKEIIKSIAIKSICEVEMVLCAKGGRKIKAEDATASIFKLRDSEKKMLRILKTDTIFTESFLSQGHKKVAQA